MGLILYLVHSSAGVLIGFLAPSGVACHRDRIRTPCDNDGRDYRQCGERELPHGRKSHRKAAYELCYEVDEIPCLHSTVHLD